MPRRSTPVQQKKKETSLLLITKDAITKPRKKLAPPTKRIKDKTKYDRRRERHVNY